MESTSLGNPISSDLSLLACPSLSDCPFFIGQPEGDERVVRGLHRAGNRQLLLDLG